MFSWKRIPEARWSVRFSSNVFLLSVLCDYRVRLSLRFTIRRLIPISRLPSGYPQLPTPSCWVFKNGIKKMNDDKRLCFFIAFSFHAWRNRWLSLKCGQCLMLKASQRSPLPREFVRVDICVVVDGESKAVGVGTKSKWRLRKTEWQSGRRERAKCVNIVVMNDT